MCMQPRGLGEIGIASAVCFFSQTKRMLLARLPTLLPPVPQGNSATSFCKPSHLTLTAASPTLASVLKPTNACNAKLPPDKQLTPQNILIRTQKQLSDNLDEVGHNQRLQQARLVDQATLQSECQQGAKELWQVTPSEALGLAVPAAEFVTNMRLQLRMLENPEGDWCPLCDQVLDGRGHHAKECCAGGDRTRRHNATHNKVFNLAQAAGCNP